MPIVRVNGLDIQVTRLRSGGDGYRPLVVGIHGLGIVDSSSLSFTLGLPMALTFDVLLYDLRGHGRSQFVASGYQVARHVEDLVALLDALDIDEPVHLLGGSYGGAVAIVAAVEHPERVASLALVDPNIPGPEFGSRLGAMLDEYVEKLNGPSPEDEILEVLGSRARRRAASLVARGRKMLEGTAIVEDVRHDVPMAVDDYARISCPVLAVYGDESEIYDMAETLGGLLPAAEMVVVPGADHVRVFHRVETREALSEFILRVDTERRALGGEAARRALGGGTARRALGGEAANRVLAPSDPQRQ